MDEKSLPVTHVDAASECVDHEEDMKTDENRLSKLAKNGIVSDPIHLSPSGGEAPLPNSLASKHSARAEWMEWRKSWL